MHQSVLQAVIDRLYQLFWNLGCVRLDCGLIIQEAAQYKRRYQYCG